MYEVQDDTYCYPGIAVLKNKLDLKDAARLAEGLRPRLPTSARPNRSHGALDYAHYKAIHHHLFQDVYDWAGTPRSVRISKVGNPFCYPEHIDKQMEQLFGWLRTKDYLRGLAKPMSAKEAAHFLAELNAIHPFREGNGRTQLSFLTMLAEVAGHPLDLERLDPQGILEATIESFSGNESGLAEQIALLL